MTDPLAPPSLKSAGEDESSSSLSPHHAASPHEILLEQLDRTIARFGDDPLGHPSPKPTSAEESLIRTFAPTNLEGPFQELYSILYPCLRPRRSSTEDATTASVIIMGPRGSGKSLLVERCLAACQDTSQDGKESGKSGGAPHFRKVLVNGIVVRGENVSSVICEIIQQLSVIAAHERGVPLISDDREESDNEVDKQETVGKGKRGRRCLDKDDEFRFRLRNSSFSSNLALLESSIQMAEIDRIPIVLVLDELDTFFLHSKEDIKFKKDKNTSQPRQLLLYYLFDRVATPGSNLTLIGLTSDFTALKKMEKRVKSRLEGTSKFIYVKPPVTFDVILQILVQDKLNGCPVQDQIASLLSPSTSLQRNENRPLQPEIEEAHRVAQTLQREFRMGQDMRWFCRVLHTALSLYRFDCVLSGESCSENELPLFSPNYLLQALVLMGSLCLSDASTVTTTNQSSLRLVDGVAVDSRLQASLLDLSQPQVALLLAARRILTREAHLEQAIMTNTSDNTVGVAPLTLQRMIQEYQSFRRGIETNEELLTLAAEQLLERGVFVPSLDHSGGGPLQYHVSLSYQTLDPYSFSRLPLHFPTSLAYELEDALQRNLLGCSAALKEWGRKTN